MGRLAPWARPLSKAAARGAKICVLTSPWGDKLQESLSLGDGETNPSSWTFCSEHSGPTTSFPGVPLGVTDPPLTLPGATQEGAERGGTGVSGTPPPNQTTSELIRGTFLEEVPMGMVEGPFSKEAAASRCGCDSEDLCPGPLAGIDEGDKIRTIYDGSVGGANDTIRNQTVERTTAPTVLDGVQALHWLHAAAEEGPPSQGA